MTADQLACAATLSNRRKQLDAFTSDVVPVFRKAFSKAKGELDAYEEANAGIVLPARLERDLDAAIESLEKSEQWARKESSKCMTQLADLVTELSTTPIEFAAP